MVQRLEKGDTISARQVEEITDAAFGILQATGIKVVACAMRDALLAKGRREEGGRFRVSRSEAQAFLQQLRNDPGLVQEAEEKRAQKKLSGVMASYALYLDDPVRGEAVPLTAENLEQATKFAVLAAQKHGGFCPFAPGTPVDVPGPLQSLFKYKLSAEYGSGKLPTEPTSPLSAEGMFAMAQVMGQPIRRLPVYPVSPLTLGGEASDIVWRFKDKLDSFYVFSMPMLGCTSPLSVSGSLAMVTAEVLGCAFLMHALTGLDARICPNIFPMDFRAVGYAFGSPRKFLYECLCEDFTAQLLDRPICYHSTNIHTASAVPGVQSGMEKTALLTAGAFLGATTFYCVGSVSLDEVFSPAELILDALRLAQVQEMVDGLEPEPLEGLESELQKYLGQGFLTSPTTLKNHKDYVNYSPFINRNTRSAFEGGRSTEMLNAAKAEAARLFVQDCPPTASAEQMAELAKLYDAAQSRL